MNNIIDTHLSLCELELLGELHPLGDGEVLVLLELGFEGLDLRGGEGRARPLLPVVGRRRGAATATAEVRRGGVVWRGDKARIRGVSEAKKASSVIHDARNRNAAKCYI